MPPRLKSFGLSDIGLVRPNNEDVWAALPEIGFFALADGMGGHQAGEVAAKEAIDHLSHKIREIDPNLSQTAMIEKMRDAIESANRWVHKMSRQSSSYTGMGTTLCCVYWSQTSVIYAHVGDSRIYRLRGDQLDLLTQDHSLFAKWMSMGEKAKECETPYPYKNVITRAIGTHAKANPEITFCPFEPGDLFFLCSDGLSDVLESEEIKKILHRSPDLATAAGRLIQKAKIKGSHDNITVLIIQCEGEDAKNLFGQQLDDGSRPESSPGYAGGSQRPASEPV
ncbi:MAG: serine/threonine-protein phosphatase [Verrucomicrobia bacterium]|nr:serine/threonine-protein phosphatase [Verrucomicrobiota bacterium]